MVFDVDAGESDVDPGNSDVEIHVSNDVLGVFPIVMFAEMSLQTSLCF